MHNVISADWPAASHVRAFVTTRHGGVSSDPFASNNLAVHVGDAADAVQRNRDLLIGAMPGCNAVQWLDQYHSTVVHTVKHAEQPLRGDALHTSTRGLACAVLTADCLPVFLCDKAGTEVAVVHAGWRGLAAGIVARAVEKFRAPQQQLLAWLGPAISQPHFEVGAEVALQLRGGIAHGETTSKLRSMPSPSGDGRELVDLYQVARLQLQALNVGVISGGNFCTYVESDRFFSFRRDGVTGRMASVVYLSAG